MRSVPPVEQRPPTAPDWRGLCVKYARARAAGRDAFVIAEVLSDRICDAVRDAGLLDAERRKGQRRQFVHFVAIIEIGSYYQVDAGTLKRCRRIADRRRT